MFITGISNHPTAPPASAHDGSAAKSGRSETTWKIRPPWIPELRFSAGSTEEEAGFDDRPTEAGRQVVLEWAQSVMPCLEDARVVQHLAGLRPLSSDGLPIIGPVPGLQGAYLATGHGRKGIHLSFVTGQIIADLILRGSTSLPLAPFLPGRFTAASALGG